MKNTWFVFLLLLATAVNAQIPAALSQLADLKNASAQREMSSPAQSPALERPVDPNEYVLGPGDRLQIWVAGRSDQDISVVISPEGTILIPSVGLIQLAELTLEAGRQRIFEQLSRVFRTDRIYVTLTELRKFRVSVSGAVQNSRLVTVTAASRVTDAISEAGGFLGSIATPPAASAPTAEGVQPAATQVGTSPVQPKIRQEEADLVPSRRRVKVHRYDGQIFYADLVKYYRIGDISNNPVLLDGDRIVVPYQDAKTGKVIVDGAVRAPGEFEYLPGDTVGDLLAFGHGLSADADSSHIVLVRFVSGTSRTEKILLPFGEAGSEARRRTLAISLRSDDRVWVRPKADYHLRYSVTLQGQIARPGIYAIDGETRWLSQIIEIAGGPTPNACLSCAFLQRQSLKDQEDPELDRLQMMQTQSLIESEREYFKFAMRQNQGVIALDLDALLIQGDKRYDLLLQDGDEIVLPVAEKSIAVFGQVLNPGHYRFNPDYTFDDYIRLAGGYNHRANKSKARIIRDISGEWLVPGRTTGLEDGDRIFVPEKADRRGWWDITKEVIAVASQVATVYLIIQTTTGSNE
ncbi:SLBB domain-containing protein [candidate division KSB1 bacterium]|nr:SLBB domain-containing protein [candidate division KSB1 bacterium]